MKNALTKNLSLKILSLIVAFTIWFVVININDPVDRTTFRNVPVTILNTSMLTDKGKVFEVLDGSDSIDVTVWAQRTVLDTLGKENIIATADMGELTLSDSQVKIKLYSNKNNDRLESIIPSSENLMVNIENLKKRQLVVDITTTGEPADGYILGSVNFEKYLVRITGAESIVDKVSHAQAVVDVSGLSQSVRTDATIKLLDENGNPIEDTKLSKDMDRVNVRIEILQQKRVPVEVSSSGTPAEGYTFTGEVSCSPAYVDIAAPPALIKNIDSVSIPDSEINLTGQADDLHVKVNIKDYLPDNVVLSDKDSSGVINVTAKVEKTVTKSIILDETEIMVKDLPPEYACLLPEGQECEIVLSGIESDVASISSGYIKAYIDIKAYMDSLEEGLTGSHYRIPINVDLTDSEGVSVIKADFVEVILEKIEEE